MSIYLDYIFIENFIITLIILLETAYLTRKSISKIRLILGAIISSIYVCTMLVFKIQEFNYIIAKLLLTIIVIYIAFNIGNVKEYIKSIAVFYVVTSVNLGVNIFISQMFDVSINNLKVKSIVYLGSLLASYLIFRWLWKIYKNNITNKDYIYKVIVHLGGKMFIYNGFLDTGNSSKEILRNKYILFASKKDNIEKQIQKNKLVEIDISMVGGKYKSTGVMVRKVEVEVNNKNYTGEAIIVFDSNIVWKNKQYDMILNYEFIKEIGGIKI